MRGVYHLPSHLSAHTPLVSSCLPPPSHPSAPSTFTVLPPRPLQELLPSEASFGTLKTGSLYRLKLKLVNVTPPPAATPC